MAADKDTLLIEIILQNQKAIADIKRFSKQFGVSMAEVKKSNSQLVNNQRAVAQAQEKSFSKMKNNIMSAGLSMLFTGMALKKMFQDVATTAITTYNKINANTALANNAVTRLAVSMDYVYYVIGDALASALDSLMPMILSVVDTVTDWIEKNPELTGQIILWGIIISSVVMVLGQMGLAVLGIISALQLLGVVKGGSIFSAIGTSATTAGTAIAGAEGNLLSFKNLAVAGITLYLAFEFVESLKSLEKINSDNFVKQLAAGIKTMLLGAAVGAGVGFIIGGPLGALVGAKIGAATSTVAIALVWTGLWDNFKNSKNILDSPEVKKMQENTMNVTRTDLFDTTGGSNLFDKAITKMRADTQQKEIVYDYLINDLPKVKLALESANKTTLEDVDRLKKTTSNIADVNARTSVTIEDTEKAAIKTKEVYSVLATDKVLSDVNATADGFNKLSKIDFGRIVSNARRAYSDSNSLSILSR